MKPGSKGRRLAGIVAVAAVAPACTVSPSPPAALRLACTTVPVASAAAAGTGGQGSRWDLPPVPGGFLSGVAARSSSSAYAVGQIGLHITRALVAHWNGAGWRTLGS